LYFLGWAAVAPLLIALLRAREPDTLQLQAGVKLLPASPAQAFLLVDQNTGASGACSQDFLC